MVVLLPFAIWKLHDLIYNFGKQPIVVDNKGVGKKIATNQQLTKFFAEYVWMTMNKKTKYEPAPKDVYDFIGDRYQEWYEGKDFLDKK